MTAFVTRYDFRGPGADAPTRARMFAVALEQAAYVDARGHDALMLSEHHGVGDGYLPAPLLVASAMAARTSRIPISISALLANLYDPLRLAEDIAVLDLVSGGRVTYTFGLGYRRAEYELLGRAWETRGRDIEAAIQTMLDAWATGRVTPTPLNSPPFLFYGGGSPAAARRAARLGLGFAPQHADLELKQLYRDECERLGKPRGIVLLPPPGPATVFCAEDPDAFWATHGSHLLADALGYREWLDEGLDHHVSSRASTLEELRAEGRYVVATPDDLIASSRAGDLPLITSHPLCGGMPEEPAWESLRLISEVVLPALRPAE